MYDPTTNEKLIFIKFIFDRQSKKWSESDNQYYIIYKWSERDTRKKGRFLGEFSIVTESGELI